jgi:hypothetical protein
MMFFFSDMIKEIMNIFMDDFFHQWKKPPIIVYKK